jgi:DNA-binding response OmpR family regulator
MLRAKIDKMHSTRNSKCLPGWDANAEIGPRVPPRGTLEPINPVSFAMPRVLVIDDQSSVRTMIAMVLRVHGFDIVEAASGEAGLKAFEESKFDLAIVDVFLQGANGLDVVRTMRQRIANFPIIVMSGMTALDFVSSTPELPNVICLQKPFRPGELKNAIEVTMVAARQATGEEQAY